jgi:hypothetical protein
MISKVSGMLEISEDKLSNIIKNCEPVEKLRWFKKTLNGRNKPNVKYNGNPLNIFNINHSDHNLPLQEDLLATKTHKYLPILTLS